MSKKRAMTALFWVLVIVQIHGQVTIEDCREKARANYPLTRQLGLVEEKKKYDLFAATTSYFPQLSLSLKATYQSDVTELPIAIPGFDGMDKDQYQAIAEIDQTLWDGGAMFAQREIIGAASELERTKVEVDLYALNQRVDQLFFGTLLVNAQLAQNKLLLEELETNADRIEAYMRNGIANHSDYDALRVEKLNAEQRRVELLSARGAYVRSLSLLIDAELSEESSFVVPTLSVPSEKDLENHRPELLVLDAQDALTESEKASLYAALLPRFGLFVQGAYGKPGLNMFATEPYGYYIAGGRLLWNLGGFYSLKSNLERIEAARDAIEAQKETFLRNSEIQATQHRQDIEKIRQLIQRDERIIALRGEIKKAVEEKQRNGTASVVDLIREINAESSAKQVRAQHEIQLLMAISALQNTINAYPRYGAPAQ